MRYLMSAVAALALAASTVAQPPDDHGLPLPVRQYLVEQYLVGTDPTDRAVDAAVEVLRVPQAISDAICSVEWEKGQVERFAANKLFLILHCPDGPLRTIVFRDGKPRNDQLCDESRVRVLKRLYSDASFTEPPAPELQAWLDSTEVDATRVLNEAIAKAEPPLDPDTLARATKNLFADKTNTDALARALGALSESPHAAENCWAGVWVISRMDAMSFRREQRDLSVPDLQAVDARTFYENVHYAVKARTELPWGMRASETDFLQQVLSQRLTGEPLQRWRKHFWDALYPEIEGLGEDGIARAQQVASCAYGDYFQYEGDTTWEDFGMLTSLAVHEGRCEDCSNVLNAMLRTIGIPACQAYTPWWGDANGNHAWTWVRGVGDPPGDGRNGVKVYVKTWDGLDDVTADYTPVTTIEVSTASETQDQAELMVYNDGEWRRIAQAAVANGAARFENVGCRKRFVLLVRIPGDADLLADLLPDGLVRWLSIADADPDDGQAFEVAFDKSCPLGEFKGEADYTLEVYAAGGWKPVPCERVATGAARFMGRADRLYRLTAEGITDRPFTVERNADTGGIVAVRR